jgi:hypothetical protein
VGGAPPLRSFAGRHRSPLCPTFQHPAPPFRPIDVNSRHSRVAFRIPERIPAGGTAAHHGPGRARGARHVAASREPGPGVAQGRGVAPVGRESTGGPGRSEAPSARALTSDDRGDRRCGGRVERGVLRVTTIRGFSTDRAEAGAAPGHTQAPAWAAGLRLRDRGRGLGQEGGCPRVPAGPVPARADAFDLLLP